MACAGFIIFYLFFYRFGENLFGVVHHAINGAGAAFLRDSLQRLAEHVGRVVSHRVGVAAENIDKSSVDKLQHFALFEKRLVLSITRYIGLDQNADIL